MKYKITKPIRLIELFAGYGSQSLSLKYLGVPFEHWRISEWAVKSIKAYYDMHVGCELPDHTVNLTDDEVVEQLSGKVSWDYSTPMDEKQIRRCKIKPRDVLNYMFATNNLGSITTVHGSDLGIVETDKYEYIMTYSFPCQDLSLAGLMQGMQKGSGTRSGLLWEVERILNELNKQGGKQSLPQILLMENVPAVCGKKNADDFSKWVRFLESLGYTNEWKIINATGFKVPQNRKRCFMVSILGECEYSFPKERPLDHILKDLLEGDVDDRYYLNEETVQKYIAHTERERGLGNNFAFKPTTGGVQAVQSQENLGRGRQITTSRETTFDNEPLNPYQDGTCRPIKSQYNQTSMANFVRTGSHGATGVCSQFDNVERERERERQSR